MPRPSLVEKTVTVRSDDQLFAVDEWLTPALLAKAFRGELVTQDADDKPAAELHVRMRWRTDSSPDSKTRRTRSAHR